VCEIDVTISIEQGEKIDGSKDLICTIMQVASWRTETYSWGVMGVAEGKDGRIKVTERFGLPQVATGFCAGQGATRHLRP
jgi:hypothetical protein